MKASTIIRTFRDWDATHKARFKAWVSMLTILAAEDEGILMRDIQSQAGYLRKQEQRGLLRIEKAPEARTSGSCPCRVYATTALHYDLGLTPEKARRIVERWQAVKPALQGNLDAWHTLLEVAAGGSAGTATKSVEYCAVRRPIIATLLRNKIILPVDASGTRLLAPDRTLVALRLESEESTGNHKTPKPAGYYRAGM